MDLASRATLILDEEGRVDNSTPTLRRQNAIHPRQVPRRPSIEPVVALDSSTLQWDQHQRSNSSMSESSAQSMSDDDFEMLRKSLPSLHRFSTSFLRSSSVESLLALNKQVSAVESAGSRPVKQLEKQLADNNKRVNEVTTFAAADDDNQLVLHPARFLPAPATPASAVLERYKSLYPEGQLPTNYHDLGFMGLECHVTAKV